MIATISERNNRITFNHYDLLAGKFLKDPADATQTWQEVRDNTVLGHYCDGATFTFGRLPSRLFNLEGEGREAIVNLLSEAAPPGQDLIAASKAHFLYADPQQIFKGLPLDELLRRLTEHKGGSLIYRFGNNFGPLISSCQSGHLIEATVLFGDEQTGENGGYLDTEQFRYLTDDGQGIVSPELCEAVFGTIHHQIQFRTTLLDQLHYGKGTLLPRYTDNQEHRFEQVNFEALKYHQGLERVDLILPLSCFKGSGKTGVKPGLQTVRLWMGERDRSPENSTTRSTEVGLINRGYAQDIIARQSEQLAELETLVNEPRSLEHQYLKTANERYEDLADKYREEGREPPERRPDLLYDLIDGDPHRQLLSLQKFQQLEEKFLSRQYSEAATAGFIRWKRTFAVGSKRLQPEQIANASYPQSEHLGNYRSPMLLESALYDCRNTLNESKAYAPDGSALFGVTVICTWDWSDYINRLTQQLQPHVANPSVQQFLEALPSATAIASSGGYERQALIQGLNDSISRFNQNLPIKADLLPLQTQTEGQQIDFDGDALSITPLKELPATWLEISHHHHLSTAPVPLVKEAKVDYPLGISREEMAYTMAEPPVGLFNNFNQAVLILKQELRAVQASPFEYQRDYAHNIISACQRAIAREVEPKSPVPINEDYREMVLNLATYAQKELSVREVSPLFEQYSLILEKCQIHSTVNNQRTVDLFKSALSADQSQKIQDEGVLVRLPTSITAKKESGIFTNGKTIAINGYSNPELLIYQANQAYSQIQENFEVVPIETVKGLFPQVHTHEMANQVLLAKQEYDRLYNAASANRDRVEREKNGLALKAISPQGTELDISFAHRYLGDLALLGLKPGEMVQLTLLLSETPEQSPYRHSYPLKALTTLSDGREVPIGLIHQSLVEAYNLSPNSSAVVSASFGLVPTKGDTERLFNRARDFVNDWVAQIPQEQRFDYACAAWEVCTTRESSAASGDYKVNNFVFEAFPEEIKQQCSEFQFTTQYISELATYGQAPLSLFNADQPLDLVLKKGVHPEKGTLTPIWHVKDPQNSSVTIPIGAVWARDYRLPVGTQLQGRVSSDPSTTANLEIITPKIKAILGDKILKVGKLQDFEAAKGRIFQGDTLDLTLRHYLVTTEHYLFLGDQQLGLLDAENFKALSHSGINLLGAFEVTINSSGVGQGLKHLVTLPDGQVIDLPQIFSHAAKPLKERSFTNEKILLNYRNLQKSKPQWGLEVTVDGKPQTLGIFTDSDSRQSLKEAQLFKDGLKFQAKLTSNVTRLRLDINPDTIRYPELGNWEFLKDVLVRDSQKVSEKPSIEPKKAEYYLNRLQYQPNLFYRTSRSWRNPDGEMAVLDTLGLTVDVRNLADVTQFFKANNIAYLQRNNTTYNPQPGYWERQRSMVSVEVPVCDLSERHLELLVEKYGTPQEAHWQDSRQSPYHQALKAIPQRPPAERRQLAKEPAIQATFEAGNSEQLRQLPNLLSQENYQGDLNKGQLEPTWRLTVTSAKVEAFTTYLANKSIPYRLAPEIEIPSETRLGYGVIQFKKSDLPESVQTTFLSRFDLPLNAELGGNYWERLEQIEQGSVPQTLAQWLQPPQDYVPTQSQIIEFILDPDLTHTHQDLLKVSQGIIVHQVNCQGIMGAGLAAQIKAQYPQVYQRYREKFQTEGWQPGEVQFVQINDQLWVANLAGQNGIGTNTVQTDLNALAQGLQKVQATSDRLQLPIYLPYRLGAGLAGGKDEAKRSQTWQSVTQLIEKHCPAAVICHQDKTTLETSQLNSDRSSSEIASSVKPDNPYLLVPYSDNPKVEANRLKDRAMAALATQFLGFSAQSDPNQLSSTRDYYQCWYRYGLANTGNYTADDVVMISGSGPWRGVTHEQIQATFDSHYRPLLEKVIAAKATVLVGKAAGTDRLVQDFLTERGYQFKATADGYCRGVEVKREISGTNYLKHKEKTMTTPPDLLPTLVQTARERALAYQAAGVPEYNKDHDSVNDFSVYQKSNGSTELFIIGERYDFAITHNEGEVLLTACSKSSPIEYDLMSVTADGVVFHTEPMELFGKAAEQLISFASLHPELTSVAESLADSSDGSVLTQSRAIQEIVATPVISFPQAPQATIGEFSRQLQTPRYSPHYQRWVSTGYEKEIGWESQPVPLPIQEAVHNNSLRINDNYPPSEGEVALLGREIGNYAVLAVATREIDDSKRPLVAYRYFWLEKTTPDTDGVGALLDWWQETGQPTFHLAPEQMQEECQKPKWAAIREGQPVSSSLKEPESLPHVLSHPHEQINYQGLHALSLRLKEQYNIPVAWAWNVQCLEKPDVFNLIGCCNEKSAELNAKYIKHPQWLSEKPPLRAHLPVSSQLSERDGLISFTGERSAPPQSLPQLRDLFTTLPLSQEYQMVNLIQQQQRTEQVAPALAAFLKAQQFSHPERFSVEKNVVKFEGKDNTVTWDGTSLTLTDKITNQPKMIAQAQTGKEDVTWKALPLPQGSTGLSEQDVQKFTNPQFTQAIKQALLEQGQKTAALSR